MENRNVQGRTLLPHQRKIWTEAFKASMHHTSIESAERKAWQAVDICERVGAFHKPETECSVSSDYKIAFRALHEWLAHLVPTINPNIHGGSLFNLVNGFDCGDLDPDEFSSALRSLNASKLPQSKLPDRIVDGLLNWIGSMRTGNVGSDKLTQFWQTIQSFDEGEIDFADFKAEIKAIVPFD